MKYVKTRDGKVFAKITWTINGEKIIGAIGMYDLYQECDIEKEADNIEELCDEFVVEYFNKELNWINHENFNNLDTAKEMYEIVINNNRKNPIIYGAIWTNKGLIYVAKMNNKGELELI